VGDEFPGERPSVGEFLVGLRQLEKAIRIALNRVDDEETELLLDEEIADIETIRTAAMALSGWPAYETLSILLGLTIWEFQGSNVRRAKVRLLEVLHLVVNDPVRLLDRPGVERSKNLTEK
jgi:hypothetical protein